MVKMLTYMFTGLLISLKASTVPIPYTFSIDSINDGPYIFSEDFKIKAKWIESGKMMEEVITAKNFTDIRKKFNLKNEYKDLNKVFSQNPYCNRTYKNVDSIGVITDIHGEYKIYTDLLRNNGIVDANLDWNFGTGHLVILGDVMDRGDMVTEVLWHLFGLEKQAEKAGGKVHFTLGNHEVMVLSQDLRYISEKYKSVETIMGTRYHDLFSERSVLGKWLRIKPVAITINDIMFIHAGISDEMVKRRMSLNKINQLFSTGIVGVDMETVCQDEELLFLSDSKGPIWYRGYFDDPDFCESEFDNIMKYYRKKHIVVGHTPRSEIQSYFNKKIIGADSGIGIDQPGEMVIIKNGVFYRGFCSHSRVEIQ